jgi:serine/threonine protein kinase
MQPNTLCGCWGRQVLKEGHVTPASDVYSFAILLYEMYTRKHLFKGLLHSQACALRWPPLFMASSSWQK